MDPVICEKCLEYENVTARLFFSYSELQKSGIWEGDDKISDPFTSIAVWIGKSNAGRGSMKNWWFCCPAHPNCSHIYVSVSPDIENDISEEDREGIWGSFGLVPPDDNSIEKGFLNSGIWSEKTCSCGSEKFYENSFTDDSIEWLDNYIDSKLTAGKF